MDNIQKDGNTRQPFLRRRVLSAGINLLPQRQIIVRSSGSQTTIEGKEEMRDGTMSDSCWDSLRLERDACDIMKHGVGHLNNVFSSVSYPGKAGDQGAYRDIAQIYYSPAVWLCHARQGINDDLCNQNQDWMYKPCSCSANKPQSVFISDGRPPGRSLTRSIDPSSIFVDPDTKAINHTFRFIAAHFRHRHQTGAPCSSFAFCRTDMSCVGR